MQLAVKQRDAFRDLDKRIAPKRPSRYTVLSEFEGGGRAEILLALPTDADTLDQLVVIKAFRPELPGAPPAELADELSLAARLDHENIARTLSIGFEWGRYFVVREYLEGTTLRSLLGWASLAGQALPSSAVARIVLGIVRALEHGDRAADSAQARTLINQPVAADDVFITYDGAVKLLGFKAAQSSAPELRLVPTVATTDELASGSLAGAGAQTAIDALLSSHLTPELARVFARMASSAETLGADRFQQVVDALEDGQLQELAGDGRAALAAVMAQVWPEARARHTAKLLAALCELRPPRAKASLQRDRAQEVAPVSEHRARGSAASRGPSGVEARPVASVAGSEVERQLDDRSRQGVAARGDTPKRSGRRAIAALLAGVSLAGFGALYLQSGSGGDVTPPPGPGAVQVQTPLTLPEQGSAEAPRAAPAPEVWPPRATPEIVSVDPNAALSKSVPALDHVAPPLVGAAADPSERSKRSSRPSKSARHVANGLPAPPGYLTLDTTPWSNVARGGASLGQTPLVDVELPPGEHLLDLVNPELGITSRYVVSITSGMTTVRRLGLEQPAR